MLVYLVADNDLEPFAVEDLAEMAAIGSNDNLRFVVQVDRSSRYSSDPVGNLGNFTSTKRLVVRQGRYEQVQDLGEANMGDPAVLGDFIAWGAKRYPAERYALVLWDHGGGLRGFGWDLDPATGAQVDNLTVPEIVTGVSQGLQRAGIDRFDLLGFDACLMATYEVAQALKAHARFVLASEEAEPGHGWDYRSFALARSAPAPDPTALGKRIADGFRAQAQAEQTVEAVTLSLVDVSKLGEVETALGAFADAYAPAGALTPEIVVGMARGREGAVEYGASPNPADAYNLVDAGHLFELISAQAPQAAALAQAVHAAMASAVAYQVTGPATSSSHGMSIYFPPAAVYYDPEFDQAVGVERWRALLKAYYQAAAAARAPEFACGASGACTHTPTNTEETLRGRLASGSVAVIADAVVRYGVPTNGDVGVFLLGDAPASYWTASGVEWAEGTWDYSLLSLEQGTLSSYGYLSWQDLGAGKVRATIPLAYWESPSSSPVLALWQLVFQGGSLIQDTYFAVSDTGAVAELAPVAGSVFQTVVAYQEALAAAWAPSWTYFTGDARFDAAQPIGPNLVTLNTNVRFFMSLAVENAAGAGDYIYAITTRPYY